MGSTRFCPLLPLRRPGPTLCCLCLCGDRDLQKTAATKTLIDLDIIFFTLLYTPKEALAPRLPVISSTHLQKECQLCM